MPECTPLGQQGFRFARFRRGALDLIKSAFHRGALKLRLAEPVFQSVTLVLGGPEHPEGRRHLPPQGGMSAHRIHAFPGSPGLEQGQILSLAVHLGKQHSHRPEPGHRDRCAVQGNPIGSRAPPRCETQFPPYHEFAVLGRNASIFT